MLNLKSLVGSFINKSCLRLNSSLDPSFDSGIYVRMTLEKLRPFFELAFSEGGNAAFWISLGGIFSVIFGLIILLIFIIIARKQQWPSEDRAGAWCRRFFIGYCIFIIPAGTFFSGATWGFITALKKAVYSQQVIEQASEKAFNPLVASIYVAAISNGEVDGNVDIREEGRRFLEEGQAIDIFEFEKRFEQVIKVLRDGIIEEVLRRSGSNSDGIIAELKGVIVSKIFVWAIESKSEEIIAYVEKILDEVKNTVNLSQISCSDVSFQICQLYVKPYVEKEFNRYRKFFVIISLFQLIVLVGLPMLIIHFVFKVARKPQLGKSLTFQ